MIKIECYEVKYPTCGNDYFNGGWGEARDWATECYATEAEAIEGIEEKKATVRKEMAWADWWVKKYANDEAFTYTKTVKVF